MVWSKVEPATGRTKYVKRYGNIAFLSTDKKNAADEIPEGWELEKTKSGHIKLRRIRD